MNIEAALKEAMNIDGALGVSLVDWESGMSLGAVGGGKYLDLDVAAAGNTEVIRAKMRTMESLRLDDTIEDILITLRRRTSRSPATTSSGSRARSASDPAITEPAMTTETVSASRRRHRPRRDAAGPKTQ